MGRHVHVDMHRIEEGVIIIIVCAHIYIPCAVYAYVFVHAHAHVCMENRTSSNTVYTMLLAM